MIHVITSILHWFFPDIPKHLIPKKYCSIILTVHDSVHDSVFAFNYMYQYSKREIWKANTLKSSQLFGAIFYLQRAYSRKHKILASWRFLSAVTFWYVCTWNIYWDSDSKRNNDTSDKKLETYTVSYIAYTSSLRTSSKTVLCCDVNYFD